MNEHRRKRNKAKYKICYFQTKINDGNRNWFGNSFNAVLLFPYLSEFLCCDFISSLLILFISFKIHRHLSDYQFIYLFIWQFLFLFSIVYCRLKIKKLFRWNVLLSLLVGKRFIIKLNCEYRIYFFGWKQ